MCVDSRSVEVDTSSEVILKVVSDGKIDDRFDGEGVEESFGPNSRELKDLRRADDSSTGDERERELDQPSS